MILKVLLGLEVVLTVAAVVGLANVKALVHPQGGRVVEALTTTGVATKIHLFLRG